MNWRGRWKKAVVPWFKTLSRCLSGGTEEAGLRGGILGQDVSYMKHYELGLDIRHENLSDWMKEDNGQGKYREYGGD
jgi:hypothetical protein